MSCDSPFRFPGFSPFTHHSSARAHTSLAAGSDPRRSPGLLDTQPLFPVLYPADADSALTQVALDSYLLLRQAVPPLVAGRGVHALVIGVDGCIVNGELIRPACRCMITTVARWSSPSVS